MATITTIKMGLLLARLKLGSIFTTDKTYPKDPNPENWRTVNGAKVHLNNGKIDGGAGGKFLSNAWVGKVKHGNNSFFPLSQMNYSAKAKTNAKSSQVTSQAGAAGANQAKQAAKTASQNKAASAVAEGQTSAIAAMQQYMEQKKKQPVAPVTKPEPQQPPTYLLNMLRGQHKNLIPELAAAVDASIKNAKKTGDYKSAFYALGEGMPLAKRTVEALKNKEITQKTAQNIIGAIATGKRTLILSRIARHWNVPEPSGNVSTETFIGANPAPKKKEQQKTKQINLSTMSDSEIASFVGKAAKMNMPATLNKYDPTQRLIYAAGYNEKPKMVSSRDIMKEALKPKAKVLYRTVSDSKTLTANKIIDNIKTGDIFKSSGGGGRCYGGGMYFADDIQDSRCYGKGPGRSNTMAAVLDAQKAKIINFGDLKKKAGAWASKHPKTLAALGIEVTGDGVIQWQRWPAWPGVYSDDAKTCVALVMGYNVVDMGIGYYTVFDRSVLITDNENYYEKEFW